ncbi:hypothetical protein NMY22_g1452 [Coprinellus aureogranulatus]|nr:hypothetical protein NMY22_g1452 [Coprinellus aureogranulatus]
MKLNRLILSVSGSFLAIRCASAQSPITGCMVGCFQLSAAQQGCDPKSLSCMCTQEAYIDIVESCIVANCSQVEVQVARTLGKSECSQCESSLQRTSRFILEFIAFSFLKLARPSDAKEKFFNDDTVNAPLPPELVSSQARTSIISIAGTISATCASLITYALF